MDFKNFEREFSKIEKMKEDIDNLNKAIKKEYGKLKEIIDDIESDSCIVSRKSESMENPNSQKVNLPKDYFQNNDNIKYIKKLIKSISTEGDEELKNMWISEKYCKTWGLREGIREFLQNQYDGIITKIQNKKNLEVVKTGKEYLIDGRKKYLDYNFFKKGETKIIGNIRFDQKNNILSISNEGELILADFLLGGTKDEQKNSDLIGVFGEGMKLAILALCRLDKRVTIYSSKKIYNFVIKEDADFIKDSKPQKCLHCKIENNYEDDCKNQVKVLIHNINEKEWGNEIDNYLWLLGNDIEIYTSIDKYNDEIGQIICEEYMRNKIFVKGIFVQEINRSKDIDKQLKKDILGFNINLKVDRDRNCVQSDYDLKYKMSQVVSGIINKNVDYIEDAQKNKGGFFIKTEYGFEKSDKETNKVQSVKSQLNNLPKNLIKCLNYNDLDVYNEYALRSYLNSQSIELIWNEVNSNHSKDEQPANDSKQITNFIEEKKLPKDFYPYYHVTYELLKVLEKSKHYLNVNQKFAKYVEDSKTIEPKGKYKDALKEICDKITPYIKNFEESKVKFKKFTSMDKNFSFKNNDNIYFSSLKLEENLDKEWKFWIFIKILNISDIKIEESYSLVNELFKS